MNGFGRGGILCSACYFSPYLSVLYACECGEPLLLVAQPTPIHADLMIEISNGATGTCHACDLAIDRGRLTARTFTMAMPWPPEDFKAELLIRDRISAGLPQVIEDAKWYEPTRRLSLGKAALHAMPFDRHSRDVTNT